MGSRFWGSSFPCLFLDWGKELYFVKKFIVKWTPPKKPQTLWLWLSVAFPFICFLGFQRWVVSYWKNIFGAVELLVRKNEVASALELPRLFFFCAVLLRVEALQIAVTYNYSDTFALLSGMLTECFLPLQFFVEKRSTFCRKNNLSVLLSLQKNQWNELVLLQ